MTNIIFISGNDGSGKSTYCSCLVKKLQDEGVSAYSRKYYHNFVRICLRKLVNLSSSIQKKKTRRDTSIEGVEPERQEKPRFYSLINFLINSLLLFYHFLMAFEIAIRRLLSRADVIVIDRSFMDDMVSISAAYNSSVPKFFLRGLKYALSKSHIHFLSAGHETEYLRIVDVDLSKSFHKRKSEIYDSLVNDMIIAGYDVELVLTSNSRNLIV